MTHEDDEDKPTVVDADETPLGRVREAEEASEAGPLHVELSRRARGELGTREETLAIPLADVQGLRRDEVQLRRTVDEMAAQLDLGLARDTDRTDDELPMPPYGSR